MIAASSLCRSLLLCRMILQNAYGHPLIVSSVSRYEFRCCNDGIMHPSVLQANACKIRGFRGCGAGVLLLTLAKRGHAQGCTESEPKWNVTHQDCSSRSACSHILEVRTVPLVDIRSPYTPCIRMSLDCYTLEWNPSYPGEISKPSPTGPWHVKVWRAGRLVCSPCPTPRPLLG